MFAERVKVLRKKLGLNQTELAEQLGISQTAYSKYERGLSEPTLETLLKLTEIGQVTLDWFLRGKEDSITKEDYPSMGEWYTIVDHIMNIDAVEDAMAAKRKIYIPIKQENLSFVIIVDEINMEGGSTAIHVGDYILIDTVKKPMPGDLVVLSFEGRQMIKKLGVVTNSEVELKNFNPDYPTITIKKQQIDRMYRVIYHQPIGRKV